MNQYSIEELSLINIRVEKNEMEKLKMLEINNNICLLQADIRSTTEKEQNKNPS